ncbi:hypothetical protein EYW47_35500, partial [Paraburkholderia silviterrae]
MHTVVPGWFGLSAVWFIPLIWRLVKSVLPGGAGLRGPGTIRLWLGFVCVLLASCALEATLLHIEGFDALGHALADGLGKLLGHTAAPLVMTALLFVSLPWLIDFRWRNFFAWADDSLGLGLNIRPARPSGENGDGERPGRRASRQDAAQPQGTTRSGLGGLGSLGKLASGLGSGLGLGGDGLASGTGPSVGTGGGTAEPLDGARRKRPTVWRPQMPGKRAASAAGMGATGAAGAAASDAAQGAEAAYAAHGATRSGASPWRNEADFASPEPSPAAAWARTEPTAPAGWLRDGQPATRTPMPAAAAPNAQPADAWRNPAAGLNGGSLPASAGASRAGMPADVRRATAMGANGTPTPSTPSASFPADTRRQTTAGIGGAAAGMAASAVAGAHAGAASGGVASGGVALAGAAGSPTPWRAAPARPATTPAPATLSSTLSSPVSPSLAPMSASSVRPAAASAAHAAALASTAAVTPRGPSAPRDPLVSPFAQPAPVRRS